MTIFCATALAHPVGSGGAYDYQIVTTPEHGVVDEVQQVGHFGVHRPSPN